MWSSRKKLIVACVNKNSNKYMSLFNYSISSALSKEMKKQVEQLPEIQKFIRNNLFPDICVCSYPPETHSGSRTLLLGRIFSKVEEMHWDTHFFKR